MTSNGGAWAPSPEQDEDHVALAAVANSGAALCTIVRIEGSFSRRNGAQLAILPGGKVVGTLSDGCLEQQLARDSQTLTGPEVRRYGSGSSQIDFRLPCGGGLDILVDPAPDRAACAAALASLRRRRPASLALPENLPERTYIPPLRILAFGEGPELAALGKLACAAGVEAETVEKSSLALGRPSGRGDFDAWTAVVLLFHDHEWELALLEEMLAGDAFYIGAQGGAQARGARIQALQRRGFDEGAIERIRSPIGVPTGSRTPQMLALSVLTEIVHEYERLRPAF
jgi:xanthine dehydrogenase accessory factor